MIGPFHAPFFADFRKGEELGGVAHAAGFVDEGLFGDELAEVFVRRDHVALETLRLRAPGERADDVVGFVAVASQPGDVEGFEKPADVR